MRTTLQEVTNVFPGIMEKREGRMQVIVGRLLCSSMREMLNSEVFAGRPIRWREGEGWFERKFEVAGPIEHVQQIRERIEAWMRNLAAKL